MTGRVLGGLYAYGLYHNVQRTADIEALRLQTELDAMTPEQQERVANARLARKQEAIDAQWEEVERRRKRHDELLDPWRRLLEEASNRSGWAKQPRWFRVAVVALSVLLLLLLTHITHAHAVEIIVNPFVKSEARDKIIEQQRKDTQRFLEQRKLEPRKFHCRSWQPGGVFHEECEVN